MEAPQTEYAVRDGAHIGYQVWGLRAGAPSASGTDVVDVVDVVEFSSGLMHSIDETSEEPNWLRYTERLAEFCRLIRFDVGGIGLSDPLAAGATPSVEGWALDALAVMDAAASERAVLLAPAGGAFGAIWLAAHHPDRVAALVLLNGSARVPWAEDYPIGLAPELIGQDTEAFADPGRTQMEGVPNDVSIFAPSLAHRVGFQEWWGRAARRGASPATAVAFNLVSFSADVREHLRRVDCPVLVISRTDGYPNMVEHGRYLAEHIEGARFVTVPGSDLLPWAGEFDSMVEDIEEFVTGTRGEHAATRLLSTVLFTDMVDSTVRAAAMGDREWRGVLDEFEVNVARLLTRHDGVLVKTTGDGILARFPTPAQGVRCAAAMIETTARSGLELRAGLHAGEVELRGDDIGGLAVHIASRVTAMAGPGEVLVTGTVRDLVVGSGIVFDDRGRHNLKGVPDEWQVLAVERA